MALEKFTYDNKLAKDFAIATVLWAVVALLVGLIAGSRNIMARSKYETTLFNLWQDQAVAYQCSHFCLCGNSIFTGIYYSMPRLLKTQCTANC
ncbi:MAG: hypothetical protein R2750_08295 [Bacteroidales bacterium]